MKSKERILIIDDSVEIVKHMTKNLLPNFGYDVLYAYDGQSGLNLIRQEKPDAVVLDLNLPKMTGLDVLESLALESNDVPVVLMTGYGSEKSAIDAFRLGARDYLVKPFTAEEVKNSLGRVLADVQETVPTPVTDTDVRRAYSEMRGRVKEMNTVFSVGKGICSVLSTEKVIERALQSAVYLTSTEMATLWLENGDSFGLKRSDMRTVVPVETMDTDPNVIQVIENRSALRRSVFMGDGIQVEGQKYARSVCYVPLMAQGDLLGVLSVSYRVAPTAVSQKEETILVALSDYIAVALKNASQFETRSKPIDLPVNNPLAVVAQSITQAKAIDTLAEDTMAQLVATGAVNAGQIWLLEEEQNLIRLVACAGVPRSPNDIDPIPLGDGMVSRTIKEATPYLTNDLIGYPIPVPTLDKLDLYIDTVLVLPLVVRGEVMGALELFNKPSGEFTPADIDIFSSVADVIGFGIFNTMLHHRAIAQQRELEITLAQATFPMMIVDVNNAVLQYNTPANALLVAGKQLPAGELLDFVAQSSSMERSYAREVEVNGTHYSAVLEPINSFGRVLALHDLSAEKDLTTAKTDFIRTVSYDLRSPLSTIASFANSLGTVGELNNQQTVFAKRIQSESERMLGMVNGLLDLGRVASKNEQVREPVALEELTEFAVDRLYMETDGKQLVVDVSTVGESRPVSADSAQLYRAIENMLTFAVNESPQKGKIQVQLSFGAETVTISVKDQGKGVESADLPHLFDTFYRLPNHDEGNGLELALVKAVATGHNGRASADSKIGSGTTLYLKIPSVGAR